LANAPFSDAKYRDALARTGLEPTIKLVCAPDRSPAPGEEFLAPPFGVLPPEPQAVRNTDMQVTPTIRARTVIALLLRKRDSLACPPTKSGSVKIDT
jgi:hypothetical protein